MSVGVLKNNLVYVLQLQNFRYFVGELDVTVNYNIPLIKKDYEEIIALEAKKIEMVRMNLPFTIIQISANIDIDDCVIYFMRKYGWKSVRGGKWSEVVLLSPPEQLSPPIKMEIVSTNIFKECSFSEYKLQRTESSNNLYKNTSTGAPVDYTMSYNLPFESYWKNF